MPSYQESINQSLEYFKKDELAASVFVGKYALTDNDGDIKEPTPDFMHRRIAKEFARIEKKYPNPMSEEEIYDLIKNFEFVVPQGSPMNAIGNEYQIQSSSNCFVIEPCYDSYGGILKTDQEQVQLMKRRGGVGHDVSNIRPKGLHTNNAAKTTDGIGVFLERFSNSCREVAQGGRRGALMLTISIHHPEIETFINIKKDKSKVTGANISIRLSDEFMKAVKNDEEYEQRFPVDSKNPTIRKNVKAKQIWNQIIDAAWESAEPGLLYWDTAIRHTPSDIYKMYGFESTATNPCGEIILSNYDSCRLMVANLYSFVKNKFKKSSKFDFQLFGDVVYKAQRLMDDLIDIELEQIEKILKKIEDDPQPEFVKLPEKHLWLKIKQACQSGRRTGLGPTALGDTLAALGEIYGSETSIEMTEEIYKQLALNAYRSSINMAKERGAFSCWSYDLEKDHPFVKKIIDSLDEVTQKMYKKYGRRNIAITTTAPTGSVSVLTQTTSGIEPAYLLYYTRRKKINPNDKDAKVDFTDHLGDKWQEYKVYHHKLKDWMDITGETDIEKSPYYKATSNDVDWISSVKLQAAAQKWVCHAISKTCNLPNSATKELVSDVYMKAWEEGCKGFTVYRDGCRTGVLVSNEEKKPGLSFQEHSAPKRPKKLECDINQVTIKGESWTIFVGKYEDKPYEIFGGLSKYVHIPKKIKKGFLVKDKKKQNGSSIYDLYYGEEDVETKIHDIVSVFENPTEGAFTRTISLALRHGTPIVYIVEQLSKDDKDSDMYSFSRVISRVLKYYIQEGTKASDRKCENCEAENSIIYKEGCKTCINCALSKCG
jgi:ribonucleoside-diphosphate reductase alpha chain